MSQSIFNDIDEAVSQEELVEATRMSDKEAKIGRIAFAYYDSIKVLNIGIHNEELYWFNGKHYVIISNGDFENAILTHMRKNDVQAGMIVKSFQQMMNHIWRMVKQKKLTPSRRLLCFDNCVMNLDTMTRLEFDPKLHVINKLNYNYDPSAKCPTWDKYLNQVLPDDVMRTMQQYFGLMFVDRKLFKLEQMMVILGNGSNGKSVVYEVIKEVVGTSNVTTFDISALTGSMGNSASYNVAQMDGKFINYCSDIDSKDFSGGRAKQIISGESTSARNPYGRPFQADNIPLMISNANKLPATSDHSKGFFRRMLIIPFDIEIKKEDQNKHLHSEICKELPGVLNWVIEGLRMVKANDYRIVEARAVERRLNVYKNNADSVSMYVSFSRMAPVKVYPSQEVTWIGSSDMYGKYKAFCNENGLTRICSQKTMGEQVLNLGFIKKIIGGATRYPFYPIPTKEEFDKLKRRGEIHMSFDAFCGLYGYDVNDYVTDEVVEVADVKEPEQLTIPEAEEVVSDENEECPF